MSTIGTDSNGSKRILFVSRDKRRRTIRLGKVGIKAARQVAGYVDELNAASHTGSAISPRCAEWLSIISDELHEKLTRAKLVEPRTPREAITLGMLLNQFILNATVKQTTKAAYKQTTDSLRNHLGDSVSLASITPRHADEWRKEIVESGLAPATVSKRVHVARTIFKRAVRWGMIEQSPFADLKAGSQTNPDRSHYVPREAIASIIEHCPDTQWRAIFGLARYAGLRCPSELGLLRWGDINWSRGRMQVRSPKTAGHDGHATRVVPIVPELRAILMNLFDEAEAGAVLVLPRVADASINLRTHAQRIIGRAGEKTWPRLFHNLRASCATDWCETFPNHVAAGWLGHSPMIAASHYLQTRDAHFDLAIRGPNRAAKCGTESGTLAAQNAAQQTTAVSRHTSHGSSETPRNKGFCETMRTMATNQKANRWAIQDSNTPEKTGEIRKIGSSAAQNPAQFLTAHPELHRLAELWPTLPPAVRASILTIAERATEGKS